MCGNLQLTSGECLSTAEFVEKMTGAEFGGFVRSESIQTTWGNRVEKVIPVEVRAIWERNTRQTRVDGRVPMGVWFPLLARNKIQVAIVRDFDGRKTGRIITESSRQSKYDGPIKPMTIHHRFPKLV